MKENNDQVADIGLRALVRRLQTLPPEVPPEHSMWPEIEARIRVTRQERARRRTPPLALAASLIMAASALGLSIHTALTPAPVQTVTVAAVPAPMDTLSVIDAGYAPARLTYLRDLATRESRLDPQTRQVLLEGLHVIEATSEQIRASLDRKSVV